MTKYRYSGPPTGIKTQTGEIRLSTGAVYDLDPQDPALKLHRHKGRLEAVAEPEAKPSKKSKKSEPAAVADPAPEPTTLTDEGGQS